MKLKCSLSVRKHSSIPRAMDLNTYDNTNPYLQLELLEGGVGAVLRERRRSGLGSFLS